MAYSRWGSSRWYTFWQASESELKEEQEFCICDIDGNQYFSYAELVEDLDECVNRAVRKDNAKSKLEYQVTEQEKEELRGYMVEFVNDVEERDKEPK